MSRLQQWHALVPPAVPCSHLRVTQFNPLFVDGPTAAAASMCCSVHGVPGMRNAALSRQW